MLHRPSHLPRLARRARRRRLKHRSQTLPVAVRQPNSARTDLHFLGLRPRVRTVAAHSVGSGLDGGARLRKRERQERRRHFGDDTGLVWLCVADYRDDRSADHDFEYKSAECFGLVGRQREGKVGRYVQTTGRRHMRKDNEITSCEYGRVHQ